MEDIGGDPFDWEEGHGAVKMLEEDVPDGKVVASLGSEPYMMAGPGDPDREVDEVTKEGSARGDDLAGEVEGADEGLEVMEGDRSSGKHVCDEFPKGEELVVGEAEGL